MRKIFITGITGNSGQYFLKELEKNNFQGELVFFVRQSSDMESIKNLRNLKYKVCIGNLNNKEEIQKSMEGCNEIFHISSILYTNNIMECAYKEGIKKVVVVHTTGIYSKFKMASQEYLKIEEQARTLASENEIELLILRPTMIFGDIYNDLNVSKFIKMTDKLKIFPLVGNGNAKLQPVAFWDLGRAYYEILILPSWEYNDIVLSGEKAISMKELISMIANFLGKKTMFICFPAKLAEMLASILKIVSFNKINYVEKVLRMTEDRCFDYEKAKKMFDYTPEKFEKSLEREVAQYMEKQL